MIFGHKQLFAIESEVSAFYEEPGLAALGFFAIHLKSNSFGVIAPDATMLAAVRDEVKRRIASRGTHIAPFAVDHSAPAITSAIQSAIYDYSWSGQEVLGLPCSVFVDSVVRSHCEFHRRCDESFDDGSMVLFFDVGQDVRCIAQKTFQDKKKDVLVDLLVPADEYYGVMGEWLKWFDSLLKDAKEK